MEFERRLKIILFFFVSIFALLWVRLFYLQVMQGEILGKLAEANRTAILFEVAPRGLILDCAGTILADSVPTFVVLFSSLGLDEDDLPAIVQRLSKILQIPEEKLIARLRQALGRGTPVRLLDRASASVAFALAEQRPNLPGISVITEMKRRYPNGDNAAHVLGYVGPMTLKEFQQSRSSRHERDWLVGKMGLEKIYDSILRGEAGGMRIEVDAAGHSVKTLDKKEPVSGYRINTTINLKIQKVAEEALAESGHSGAVVAIDPRNGEILALVSAPAFDPNAFLYNRQEKEENQVTPMDFLLHGDLPLFNRAAQGTYAPGSIFKIVVAAAALESGKINPLDKIYCPGHFAIPSKEKKLVYCWKRDGHGAVNLMEAMAGSCNVYFYNIGLKIGPDAIETMARNFGLGERTSLHFQNEKKGFVPGRSMFRTALRHWYDGDTVNLAIGQGRVLLTPIQAAQMISLVASRGVVYKLHMVKSIYSPSGELVESDFSGVERRVDLSPRTWDFLEKALTGVVETGTAKNSKIAGITIAGKTGTVQNPQGKDHAWAVCYAPVENPRIALSVIVEHGEKGSAAAMPIAKKILETALADLICR